MGSGSLLRLSIVTASYNRSTYLSEAMESVLSQGYPNLEYVVVDGGSTDGSAEVVAGFSDRLSWWVSEPDGGQYEAINKGFEHTTGEIMGWLNSDDMYAPWAFAVVGEIFASLPNVEWLTTCFPLAWDKRGTAVGCGYRPGFSRPGFLRGECLPGGDWYSNGYLQQESTFWRRSLWDRCGGRLDTQYRIAADFDLWARFAKQAQLYAAAVPLGGFRGHGDQRMATGLAMYFEEAKRSLAAHGGRPESSVMSAVRQASFGRIPGRLRRWGVASGLLESRPICVWSAERGWYVDEVVTKS